MLHLNCCTVRPFLLFDAFVQSLRHITAQAVSSGEKDTAIEAFTSGFRIIFILAAVFSAVACVVSFPIRAAPLKRPEAQSDEDAAHEEDAKDEDDEKENVV